MKRAPVVPEGWRPYTTVQKARLIAEILGAYVRTRLSLRRHGLPRTVEILRAEEAVPPEGDGHRAILTGVRLGFVVNRTLRVLPTDSRCLMQSLVLTRMLARRGTDSSLVIGVKSDPAFAAHAWVEHDHGPLLPTNGGTYQRLLEL